jgi:hypothetical protein
LHFKSHSPQVLQRGNIQLVRLVLERGAVDAGERGAVAKQAAHPHAHKLRPDVERRVGENERRGQRRSEERVHLSGEEKASESSNERYFQSLK